MYSFSLIDHFCFLKLSPFKHTGSNKMPVWSGKTPIMQNVVFGSFKTFNFVLFFLISWNVNCIAFNLSVKLGWMKIFVWKSRGQKEREVTHRKLTHKLNCWEKLCNFLFSDAYTSLHTMVPTAMQTSKLKICN